MKEMAKGTAVRRSAGAASARLPPLNGEARVRTLKGLASDRDLRPLARTRYWKWEEGVAASRPPCRWGTEYEVNKRATWMRVHAYQLLLRDQVVVVEECRLNKSVFRRWFCEPGNLLVGRFEIACEMKIHVDMGDVTLGRFGHGADDSVAPVHKCDLPTLSTTG